MARHHQQRPGVVIRPSPSVRVASRPDVPRAAPVSTWRGPDGHARTWLSGAGAIGLVVGLVGLFNWLVVSPPAHPPAVPGGIERTEVILHVPAEYLDPGECNRQEAPWQLPGFTLERFEGLLRDAHLEGSLYADLARATRCDAGGCTVQPTSAAVLALPPAARSVIYWTLGRYPANASQTAPFRRPSRVPRWRDDPMLPPAARTLMDQLAWRDGDDEVFADVPAVCSRLSTDSERVRFLTVIKGRSALTARLVVPHGANIDPMVRYWRPQGGADALTLRARLTALAHRPDGGSMDVVELLPPFARRRVNTFPPAHDQADCFWTVLHFNGEADPPPGIQPAEVFESDLARDWIPVDITEARSGDALVFREPGGQAVHAVSFLADGLVFTKNGASPRRPWTLASLDDIRAVYPHATEITVYHHRPETVSTP